MWRASHEMPFDDCIRNQIPIGGNDYGKGKDGEKPRCVE